MQYDVDFEARTVTYYAANGERYVESYQTIEVGRYLVLEITHDSGAA